MGSAFEQIQVSIALTVVAAAYAAVGQGGATGYIAVLGLVGLGPDIIRPAALTLNALVSAIGTAQFARVGLINWRSVCPFDGVVDERRQMDDPTKDRAWNP